MRFTSFTSFTTAFSPNQEFADATYLKLPIRV
jgi:hypothetical protein